MTKLYSIDLRVYVTAYIKADSEEEAAEIAFNLKGDTFEVAQDDFIYGGTYGADMPDVSLSPAMTIWGREDGATPDLVEGAGDDFDNDEDDDDDAPHEPDCPATDGFGCRCGEGWLV